MDAKRWQQIERLYHEALDRPAADRQVFLAEACAGDDTLRREVEELLDDPSTADRVFSGPAFVAAARLIGDADRTALTGRRLGNLSPAAADRLGGYGRRVSRTRHEARS
jgi:hypothetical protein